jgi:hypothetical protein
VFGKKYVASLFIIPKFRNLAFEHVTSVLTCWGVFNHCMGTPSYQEWETSFAHLCPGFATGVAGTVQLATVALIQREEKPDEPFINHLWVRLFTVTHPNNMLFDGTTCGMFIWFSSQ